MANKTTKDAPTVTDTPAQEPTTLAVSAITDLAAMSDIDAVAMRPGEIERGDLSGTENIAAEEVRLPRLSIAQGLSYEMLPDDSRYIPDLKLFDLFNDMFSTVYGRGPIKFVVVQRAVRRIQFAKREDGGGILDLDVPANDPRMQWTVDPDGKRVPPAATTFIEFVILLLRPGQAPEPIVLSIKGTNKFNRRASDQLTAFIKLRNAPIYSGLYTVTTKSEKNDQGTFGVFVIKNAGFIPVATPAGKALYDYAKEFADALHGKVIVVEREPGDEDFDPTTMENTAPQTTSPGM